MMREGRETSLRGRDFHPARREDVPQTAPSNSNTGILGFLVATWKKLKETGEINFNVLFNLIHSIGNQYKSC